MLEINYGVIATVATAAMIRCYTKFVRGPEPKSINMEGKVRRDMYLRKTLLMIHGEMVDSYDSTLDGYDV